MGRPMGHWRGRSVRSVATGKDIEWIVAGSSKIILDGRYVPLGIHNGRTYWTKEGYYLFFSSARKHWYISDELEDSGFTSVASNASNPPTNGWTDGTHLTMVSQAASDGTALHTRSPAYWPGKEYTITLDKSDGTSFGIDVDVTDGKTILVDCVKGGLAERWNSAHPEQQVGKGDCIVEINAIRRSNHNIRRMLAECKRSHMVSLKLLPHEAAFPSQDFRAELCWPLLNIQDVYTIEDGAAFFPPNVISALQPDEKKRLLMIVYRSGGVMSNLCLVEESREGRDALLECLTVLCVVVNETRKG